MPTLSADDILQLHFELVAMFSDQPDSISPPGPRTGGLLESAAMRPLTSLGGVEKYPTIIAKAAALFHSLATGHPFHNGNKRTAVLCLIVMLSRNNLALVATDDEVFDFVVAVAGNTFDNADIRGRQSADSVVESIGAWLRAHSRPRGAGPRDMKVSDFLDRLAHAGCRVRQTGTGTDWLVMGQNGESFKIRRGTTNKIEGGAVKKYLAMMGLSPSVSGMYFEEFLEGRAAEQSVIYKYRNVLQRLALV
jgi:death on curing protein